MAQKTIHLPDVGEITLYKRRGARHIRLSVATNGVRVTLPFWVPYKLGAEFAMQRLDWIKHNHKPVLALKSGIRIGKTYHLQFMLAPDRETVTTRVIGREIRVMLPPGLKIDDNEVQQLAQKAAYRALKKEAESLLPQRVRLLAEQNGFSFKSLTIKRLQGRWGSCTAEKALTFNSFLMQLPWELIDYVIMHELTHTKIMAHGPVFWDEVAKHVENLPRKRKQIKTFRPALINTIG